MGKVVGQLPPLPRWVKKLGVVWSINEKVIDLMYIDHNLLFSGDYISALRGAAPSNF